MVHALVLLGLLAQAPTSSNRDFFVIDAVQNSVDCHSGAKLKSKTVAAGTLVTVSGSTERILRLIIVGTGREACIKASKQGLIAVRPFILADGTPAEFAEADELISMPRIAATTKRRPILLDWVESDQAILSTVIVILAVGADGDVKACRALRSSNSTGWDNWAMDLVCQSKYSPATKNGLAVPVTILATVAVGRK